MPQNDIDLDLTFLYEIADGSDKFIVESVGMFLDQSAGILQEIKNALDAGKWMEAAAAAHKIKANLGFFGMLNSQELMQEIEAGVQSRRDRPGHTESKFNDATGLIAGAVTELKQIKAQKEANL